MKRTGIITFFLILFVANSYSQIFGANSRGILYSSLDCAGSLFLRQKDTSFIIVKDYKNVEINYKYRFHCHIVKIEVMEDNSLLKLKFNKLRKLYIGYNIPAIGRSEEFFYKFNMSNDDWKLKSIKVLDNKKKCFKSIKGKIVYRREEYLSNINNERMRQDLVSTFKEIIGTLVR